MVLNCLRTAYQFLNKQRMVMILYQTTFFTEIVMYGHLISKHKTCPTPRAPDKCGRSPTLSGSRPQTADSASGGFVRQFPPLPVTPAVGQFIKRITDVCTLVC
jgi:hypothetical protein